MSVLIRGMEIPERCGQCFLRVGNCKQRMYMEHRPKGCPLVEVKEPHGSLVDFDQMVEDYWDGALMVIDERKFKQIESSIIIEAEGSDMNEN